MSTEPKRRGRPPGTGRPMGPRVGSQPWQLLQMAPGDTMLLQVPPGKPVTNHMQQIAVDISRTGLNGKVTQRLILGIAPDNREVFDIVLLTRLPDSPV